MHSILCAVWTCVLGGQEEPLAISKILGLYFLYIDFILLSFSVFFSCDSRAWGSEDKIDLNWKLLEPVELAGSVITLNFTLLLVSCRVILWRILSIFGSAASCHNGKESQRESLSSISEWETLLEKGKLVFEAFFFLPHYKAFKWNLLISLLYISSCFFRNYMTLEALVPYILFLMEKLNCSNSLAIHLPLTTFSGRLYMGLYTQPI